MAKQSAGILMYRRDNDGIRVLLVHPGGPFWAKKDFGAWSIPKGEYGPGDDPLEAARRELAEETGITACGDLLSLGEVVQKGGKRVTAWAVAGEFDPARLQCSTFELEWPPRSGRKRSFPEVDRAEWFTLEEARRRILSGQAPFLDRLAKILAEVS
jgi:predicted NUDIX family NTP pyrophosphohydrolase